VYYMLRHTVTVTNANSRGKGSIRAYQGSDGSDVK
jgi:hypothetical protein